MIGFDSDASRSCAVGGTLALGYTRGMNQISIIVSDDLQRWVESRIAFSYYVDASDYLRDLLRRDQAQVDGVKYREASVRFD